MSTRIDPSFLGTLERYGAFQITACFNCGNCTAVCPLSEGTADFPRRMVRYAQIGDRQRLLDSKELWQCFYCGECSDTCPRQAEPGEFMAAVRRYAISSYDLTGISRLLYTSRWFSLFFLMALTLLLTVLLLGNRGPMIASAPSLFGFGQTQGFMSYDLVHNLGLALIILAALVMVTGVLRVVARVSRAARRRQSTAGGQQANHGLGLRTRLSKAVAAVVAELALHGSFKECETEQKTPFLKSRRFIHWSIMWGFFGLLVATGADWVLQITMGKEPGQPVSIWHPTRLLGTIAGAFMVYGAAAAIIQRWTKPNQAASHSLLSDWLFLWLLLLAGLTGFVVEGAIYLPYGASWMYVALLVHVVVSMEVVVLLPFTKFAHAVYRPVALFLHNFLVPRPALH